MGVNHFSKVGGQPTSAYICHNSPEGGQDRFAFEYWYMGHKYVGSVLRAMLTMLQAGHVPWAETTSHDGCGLQQLIGGKVANIPWYFSAIRGAAGFLKKKG